MAPELLACQQSSLQADICVNVSAMCWKTFIFDNFTLMALSHSLPNLKVCFTLFLEDEVIQAAHQMMGLVMEVLRRDGSGVVNQIV